MSAPARPGGNSMDRYKPVGSFSSPMSSRSPSPREMRQINITYRHGSKRASSGKQLLAHELDGRMQAARQSMTRATLGF